MKIALLIVMIIILNSCGIQQTHEPSESGINGEQTVTQVIQEGSNMNKLPEIEILTLSENGTEASTREYEIVRGGDGVTVSLYDGNWNYDDEADREDFLEKRAEGDEELYNRIAQAAAECGIRSWNGFSGSNPNVLDGYSISFSGIIDGSSFSGHGSNRSPKGYNDCIKTLRDILYSDKKE